MAKSIDDAGMDRLLHALADATRRRLLERLRDEPGLTLSALAADGTISRQAISQHLGVLEGAQLVVTLWRGREKLHYLDPLPLQALPTRWVARNAREARAASQALKRAMVAAARWSA